MFNLVVRVLVVFLLSFGIGNVDKTKQTLHGRRQNKTHTCTLPMLLGALVYGQKRCEHLLYQYPPLLPSTPYVGYLRQLGYAPFALL